MNGPRHRLSLAQRQLLATLTELQETPRDWRTGAVLELTREALLRHGHHFFEEDAAPWEGAFEALQEGGWIRPEGDGWRLAGKGRLAGPRYRDGFRRQRFDALLRQADASRTYRTFCRRVHGADRGQLGLLDAEQEAALEQALALHRGETVLEIGCGTGHLARRLQRSTGARLVAVDSAAGVLLRAGQGRGDRQPRRLVADGRALPFADHRFDALLLVDALAFLGDPATSLPPLLHLLRPGGRIVILDQEIVPRSTVGGRLWKSLAQDGRRPAVVDLSLRAEVLLRRQSSVSRALLRSFRREGHERLGRTLVREADRYLRWVEGGNLRRFLYRAAAVTDGDAGSSSSASGAERSAANRAG